VEKCSKTNNYKHIKQIIQTYICTKESWPENNGPELDQTKDPRYPRVMLTPNPCGITNNNPRGRITPFPRGRITGFPHGVL
jgi:hypothetical protein